MAFVTATPTTRRRPRRSVDPYSAALRKVPPVIDVFAYPAALTGLGELGDTATGIPVFDDALAKIDQAAAALRITTACSIASLGISIFMLVHSLRR
jgi:hypothetical protein